MVSAVVAVHVVEDKPVLHVLPVLVWERKDKVVLAYVIQPAAVAVAGGAVTAVL